MWALTDAFTVEQAACLWVGADPSANSLSRPRSERRQIAPIAQMLSAAIQTGKIRADSSRNGLECIGDYSKSLISADELRAFAEMKDQRPAFLFDTMLQSGSGPAASASGAPGPIKSKGGRPPEYDWDAFTVEIIRIANHPDGLPDKQSELIKRMLQWCQDTWGREPAESGVKARVSNIYNGLGLGQ